MIVSLLACFTLLWLDYAKLLAWLDIICLRTCLLALLWFAFVCWLWQLYFALTVCLICSLECSDDSRKTRFWTLLKYNILTETAILVWCFGNWAWFFWRPPQEGNFKIFLATLQLHRIPNPIWFCICKLRYTVWEIWESQLTHIRF